MDSPGNTETLSTCDDAELGRRLREGSAESFAELDRRFRGRLLYALQKRLPRREDAEDVVQQTMLRVFEKRHLFDPGERLSPWVFTIALRLAVEHGRRKRLPVSPEAGSALELADRAPPPDARLDQAEQRDALWALADRVLKPDQWTALWLHYGEEMSLAEVARSLGKTKTAASVHLFRARQALLPHLIPAERDPDPAAGLA